MELKECRKCIDCNGTGEVTTMERVYPNEPHMAPIGSEKCASCGGTGEEADEEVVLQRVMEGLSHEQGEKLQNYFMELREIGGMPITKDNYEDLFENWLSGLDLSEVEQILL